MPSNVTVYIVEDDPSVRKATSRLFRAEGLSVAAFSSPQEFLDQEISDRPGCVLLDYRLPGQSGIEVQDELRTRGVSLPIVFMTAHGDVPTSVKAMKHGAVDFLPKPVDDRLLIDTVQGAIDRYSAQLLKNKDLNQFRDRLKLLTKRETEVMQLVIDGLLNKQIAARLGVTEATVKVHRGRVMEKTGLESVAKLARLYERCSDITS